MTAVKSTLSTVYIKSRITATVNGVTNYDPTGDTVVIAFVAPGVTPAGADFKAASWETVGSSNYYARALVGPGPGAVIDLAAGSYRMWIKITDNPEIPVLEAGTVRVY